MNNVDEWFQGQVFRTQILIVIERFTAFSSFRDAPLRAGPESIVRRILLPDGFWARDFVAPRNDEKLVRVARGQ
ncbi:MAG: hypothetical protein ABUL53_00105, partial [Bradyrhizobium guangdongense]